MNKIVHFEIPATDTERAGKFYRTCFGWEMNPIPQFNYTIITTGPTGEDRMPKESGFINGGMMERTPQISSPVLTIEVADIEKALTNIQQAGGKIVRSTIKVGDMGLAAYFLDTEGNVMGLWQGLK